MAVRASFDASFLELPPEVIVSVLREHQKNFAVRDAAGRLMLHFIGVSNTPATSMDTVRAGYERVVRARLSDARFYFDEDGKKPIASYAGKLSGIVFQADLGTVADKTARVVEMTGWLAEALGEKIGPATAEAARARGGPLQGRPRHRNGGRVPRPPRNHGKGVRPSVGRRRNRRAGDRGALPSPGTRVTGSRKPTPGRWSPSRTGWTRSPAVSRPALSRRGPRTRSLCGGRGTGLSRFSSPGTGTFRSASLCEAGVGILVRSVRAESPALVSSLVSFLAGRLASLLEQDGHRPDTVEAVGAAGMDHPVDFALRVTALSVVGRGGFPSLPWR